jgi:beta-lactamase class A
MKKGYLLVLFCVPLLAYAQRFAVGKNQTDKKLQAQVQQLLTGFRGDVGVYIKNLRTGKTVAINADSLYPTASMVKVPILIGIMDQIKRGAYSYHQELIYKDSLLYAGSDILGSFKNNETIELSKVMMLMLTTSDNTASLWLQSLAGTGTRINTILDSLGCRDTRVNSRTPGREADRSRYGWGQTTPYEMALLMEKIYTRQVLGDSIDAQMLRLLGRNYWDEQAIGQIPPHIFVASKNGAVDASRSEVLLVMAPGNPYLFCICTKNNQDKSWENSNEAWALAQKLSKLLWGYYGK